MPRWDDLLPSIEFSDAGRRSSSSSSSSSSSLSSTVSVCSVTFCGPYLLVLTSEPRIYALASDGQLVQHWTCSRGAISLAGYGVCDEEQPGHDVGNGGEETPKFTGSLPLVSVLFGNQAQLYTVDGTPRGVVGIQDSNASSGSTSVSVEYSCHCLGEEDHLCLIDSSSNHTLAVYRARSGKIVLLTHRTFEEPPTAACFAVGSSLLCVCSGSRVSVFTLAPRFDLMYKFDRPELISSPVYAFSRPMSSTVVVFSQDNGQAIEFSLRGEVTRKLVLENRTDATSKDGEADPEAEDLNLTSCGLVTASFDMSAGMANDGLQLLVGTSDVFRTIGGTSFRGIVKRRFRAHKSPRRQQSKANTPVRKPPLPACRTKKQSRIIEPEVESINVDGKKSVDDVETQKLDSPSSEAGTMDANQPRLGLAPEERAIAWDGAWQQSHHGLSDGHNVGMNNPQEEESDEYWKLFNPLRIFFSEYFEHHHCVFGSDAAFDDERNGLADFSGGLRGKVLAREVPSAKLVRGARVTLVVGRRRNWIRGRVLRVRISQLGDISADIKCQQRNPACEVILPGVPSCFLYPNGASSPNDPPLHTPEWQPMHWHSRFGSRLQKRRRRQSLDVEQGSLQPESQMSGDAGIANALDAQKEANFRTKQLFYKRVLSFAYLPHAAAIAEAEAIAEAKRVAEQERIARIAAEKAAAESAAAVIIQARARQRLARTELQARMDAKVKEDEDGYSDDDGFGDDDDGYGSGYSDEDEKDDKPNSDENAVESHSQPVGEEKDNGLGQKHSDTGDGSDAQVEDEYGSDYSDDNDSSGRNGEPRADQAQKSAISTGKSEDLAANVEMAIENNGAVSQSNHASASLEEKLSTQSAPLKNGTHINEAERKRDGIEEGNTGSTDVPIVAVYDAQGTMGLLMAKDDDESDSGSSSDETHGCVEGIVPDELRAETHGRLRLCTDLQSRCFQDALAFGLLTSSWLLEIVDDTWSPDRNIRTLAATILHLLLRDYSGVYASCLQEIIGQLVLPQEVMELVADDSCAESMAKLRAGIVCAGPFPQHIADAVLKKLVSLNLHDDRGIVQVRQVLDACQRETLGNIDVLGKGQMVSLCGVHELFLAVPTRAEVRAQIQAKQAADAKAAEDAKLVADDKQAPRPKSVAGIARDSDTVEFEQFGSPFLPSKQNEDNYAAIDTGELSESETREDVADRDRSEEVSGNAAHIDTVQGDESAQQTESTKPNNQEITGESNDDDYGNDDEYDDDDYGDDDYGDEDENGKSDVETAPVDGGSLEQGSEQGEDRHTDNHEPTHAGTTSDDEELPQGENEAHVGSGNGGADGAASVDVISPEADEDDAGTVVSVQGDQGADCNATELSPLLQPEISNDLEKVLQQCRDPQSLICGHGADLENQLSKMLTEVMNLVETGRIDPATHVLIAGIAPWQPLASITHAKDAVLAANSIAVCRLVRSYRLLLKQTGRLLVQGFGCYEVDTRDNGGIGGLFVHPATAANDDSLHRILSRRTLSHMRALGVDEFELLKVPSEKDSIPQCDDEHVTEDAGSSVMETRGNNSNLETGMTSEKVEESLDILPTSEGVGGTDAVEIEIPSSLSGDPLPVASPNVETVDSEIGCGVTAHALVGHFVRDRLLREASHKMQFAAAVRGDMQLLHTENRVMIDGKQPARVMVYAHYPARVFVCIAIFEGSLNPGDNGGGGPLNAPPMRKEVYWTGFAQGVGAAPGIKSFHPKQVAQVPQSYFKELCCRLTLGRSTKDGSVAMRPGRLLPAAYKSKGPRGIATSLATSDTKSDEGNGGTVASREVDEGARFLKTTKSWVVKDKKEKPPKKNAQRATRAAMKILRQEREAAFIAQCQQDRMEFEARLAAKKEQQRLLKRRQKQVELQHAALANRDYFKDGKVSVMEERRRFKASQPVNVKQLGFTVVERPE